LQKKVNEAIELTKNNSRIVLNLAFDYGGRDDILTAVRRVAEERVSPRVIDEDLFKQYLFTAALPDPDLVIRTGGEMRLSNFLIWQSAYSELYFTPVLWPDFDKNEIEKALAAYGKRERRFGKLGEDKRPRRRARG
jgi:undecaprenyl diphosphate synthase